MEPQDLFINTIITGLLFSILLIYVTQNSRAADKSKTAPRPPGSWPIIGHLRLLTGTSFIHEALVALALGPIFTIKLGVHQVLVVSSPEISREIFTTNDLAVSSRAPSVAFRILSYDSATFSVAPYGAFWRKMRKIASQEVLSSRRLELLKHVRVSEVEYSVKELYKIWAQRTRVDELSHGVVVELKKWSRDLTLNIILKMVASKKIYGTRDVDGMKEASQCNALRDLFKYLGMFVLRDAVRCLGWLDWGGHEKAMKKTAKHLDSLIGQWLEEHKQARALDQLNREHDFMDVLLSLLQANNIEDYDADTIIKATCLSMIAAGTETTIITMTRAVSLMLNNKHVLMKAQDELDVCVGREREVNESDLNNLTYLQAIVKETLGLYPAVPLIPRIFTEDCVVGGYFVPKGTWLMVNIWKIQTESCMWPNPYEFKPERFLTTNTEVDVRGKYFELMPFGSMAFSLQTVHLTLATFLHAFDISTPDDAPIDMTASPGITHLKDAPLQVLVSPWDYLSITGN